MEDHCLNGPDFGPYSGRNAKLTGRCGKSLNGPDFGPYSGRSCSSLHFPSRSLNGPDFGPYSGLLNAAVLATIASVSTGQTSAHIPDGLCARSAAPNDVSTGQTSAHIPDDSRKGELGSLRSQRARLRPIFRTQPRKSRRLLPESQRARLRPIFRTQSSAVSSFGRRVSTGQTSAHIPDLGGGHECQRRSVSTGQTSAHIPD